MGRCLNILLALACALPAPAAPPPDDVDVRKGVSLVESGEYDQAIFVLDGAVRRLVAANAEPAVLAQAYLHLGIAYVGKGHEAAARARFREAVGQIRGLTLSPDQFPPKVIDLFEAAREEALRTPAAPTAAASPAAPSVEAKKGGGSKLLLLGLGGAAAAGVAVAAGGGGGSSTPTTPRETRREQTFSGAVPDGDSRFFTVVATTTGELEATLTWQDGQASLRVSCQWSEPPYTTCGTGNRLTDTTFVLRASVDQRSYLLAVDNFAGRGVQNFTLRVLHP